MDPWLLIVIVGVAVIGYAYMRPNHNTEQKAEMVSDIESALDQFAQELEEENNVLMTSIVSLKRDLEADLNKLSGRIEAIEKQTVQIPSSMLVHSTEITNKLEPEINIEETPEIELEPNIKSRYSDLFALYSQGKSIEYIAKKSGMNNGEVQLIIQLARQEEQFRDER